MYNNDIFYSVKLYQKVILSIIYYARFYFQLNTIRIMSFYKDYQYVQDEAK